MLSLLSQFAEPDCGRTSRRDFLRIGTLGLAGLGLPALLSMKAHAAEGKALCKDKSVIFLFLCGGASQIETFDPKMNAPAEFRSTTGELPTTLPGVTFGGTFPKMARLAHQMAIVRSYQPHDEADHAKAIKKVFTIGHPMQASLGAIAARLRGGSVLPNGMPFYASSIEKEIDSQYKEDEERMTRSDAAGQLGTTCAPFTPGGDGQINRDMTLSLPLERLHDRRALLRALDQLNREVDGSGTMEKFDELSQRAVDMLLGGKVRQALDLANESPRTVASYDTSRYQVGWLAKKTCTLGRRLLIARRLCEAGCGFVTVGMAGWDNHGNGNHPGVRDGMHLLGGPLDHAVSAFLEDLQARGLSEKILLVITSEFGRTPKIEPRGGRDHWPGLCPLVLAGGGLKVGQVIGQSTARAEEPSSEPLRMPHLLATILHTLFDLGEVRVQRGLPREVMALVEEAQPITELI